MKFCIAGKNSISINAIKYLLDTLKINKENLFICINDDDTGFDSWQPSLLKYALDNELLVKNIEDVYKYKNLIFISLEFNQIINTKRFKTTQLFNIHFSLLPAYKGMYTSTHPILNGDLFSGVTLHLIDNGIDTGPIIDQLRFEIGIDFSAKDLYMEYLYYGYKLFKKSILSLINNNYKSVNQNNINSSYYSRDTIDFENISISYTDTSFKVHNQIRAYIFEDYQLPIIKGSKIIKSVLTNEKIKRCTMIEEKEKFIISGMDGFIIKVYKQLE